ncbi:MAG TPA: ABC transporter permease [Vicinamibacterales bacterium]|nr:ABC transporter permease [Vicinamibacterales bacterium]
MTALIRDLRVAVRVLLRTKAWTAVVLLSLALGIGANAALFTAVNGLLLQTVRVHEPERLIRFNWAGTNDMVRSSSDYGYSGGTAAHTVRSTFSFAIFEQMRAASTTLTDLAAGSPMNSLNVIVGRDAQLADGYEASGNFFEVIGVPAALGRVFDGNDDKPSATPVAVISYPYWQRRFAGESSVIDRVVSINGVMVTIIGVTPRDFAGIQRLGDDPPDVMLPLSFDGVFNPPTPLPDGKPAIPRLEQPTYWWLQLIGRLKPGASIGQARANFTTVFRHAARAGMADYQASLTPEEKHLSFNRQRGDAIPELLVKPAAHGYYELDPQAQRSAGFLTVVVVIVLLIVCANVANLLLSRATTRTREISVRLSLGATRGRLIRQLLTESVLLSSLGGGFGVLVGYWSRALLPFGKDAPLDWRVLGFVAGVSLITGVVFGLVPALRATRVDLAGAMKESGRSVTGSRSLLSRGLLVLQVGMSLVLIIGAGLFLRTLENLRSVDVGFDSTNLLMFNVNPSVNRYDADRSAQVFRQVLERMSALPGVTSGALTRTTLLSGSTSTSSMWKQGQTDLKAAEEDMYMMDVSPTFFTTLGIPVLRGRAFSDHDGKTAPKVAIVNEAAARELFPHGDALGRRIGGSFEKSGEYEIVGIVRDTKYESVRDPGPPTMYRCAWQMPVRSLNVVLRTAGDPLALTETVRRAMRDVDPTLPIRRFTSQSEQISLRFAQEQLFATAYTAFGALALVLACIGLFGLMSYAVARRTNEIGIRMALGAQRGTVVRMVMRESMLLVGAGVTVGLVAALWAGRFVTAVLYGLSPNDALTMSAAVGLIAVVSGLAGYLPARRASHVDPMEALREQ